MDQCIIIRKLKVVNNKIDINHIVSNWNDVINLSINHCIKIKSNLLYDQENGTYWYIKLIQNEDITIINYLIDVFKNNDNCCKQILNKYFDNNAKNINCSFYN